MALNKTTIEIRRLLTTLVEDLEKADAGNKAASQRVRTGTIRLEKIAKLYRKESINAEKSSKGKKKAVKKTAKKKVVKKKADKKPVKKAVAKKPVKKAVAKKPVKKTVAKKKPVKKVVAKKKAVKKTAVKKPVKKAVAKKKVAKKTTARARALTVKRKQTAKLPKRRTAR